MPATDTAAATRIEQDAKVLAHLREFRSGLTAHDIDRAVLRHGAMANRLLRDAFPRPGRGGPPHGEHRGDLEPVGGQLPPIRYAELSRWRGIRRPRGCDPAPLGV